MVTNRYRGDVRAVLGGHERTFRLTLAALAELETAFGVSSLAALVERLSSAALSARDLTLIIAAALRGGGEVLSADEVAELAIPGGPAGYVALATQILEAAFGDHGLGDGA